MQTLTKHQPFLLLALTTTLAATACGGSSSSSSNKSNSASSTGGVGGAGGSAASGISSGGGTNSSPNTSNNTAANSSNTASGDTGGSGGTTGTAGGAGGVDTTSSGGLGGTSGAGGATGGSDSSGGSSGDGGTAGSGGTGPTGVIGVLGEPCDSPGQLACAGNHQKLTVFCGGDGEWEVNETCTGDQFCDSQAGANAGICGAPVDECASGEVDARFCHQGDVHTCAPDGLEPALVEDCAARCEAGTCVDVEPCPEGDVLNCDPECGDTSYCFPEMGDVVIQNQGDILVFRTAGYGDAVAEGCEIASYALIFGNGFRRVRATVAAPWRVTFDGEGALQCALGGGEQCAVFLNPDVVWVYTDDPSATPANVTLEYVASDAECP